MSDVSEPIQWTPLHAEARENYSHWYKPELNPGCEGRAKFLYEQFEGAAEPVGKGTLEGRGDGEDYIVKYRPGCAMDGRMYR